MLLGMVTNNMASDVLVTQGARASAVMVLTKLSRKIPGFSKG